MQNKTKNPSVLVLWAILLLAQQSVFCQTYSLKEALEYGFKNHQNIKNAQLDVLNADARINEIKAMGLPQVNGNLGWTDNLNVPRFFVPAKTFNPNAAEGEVTAAKFGVQYSAQVGIGLSQLVFDGSYTLGLKASQVYRDLATKNLTASKVNIAESVSKAYYSVLVNEERLKLLDINTARLDSLLRETKVLNQQGFIEKLDVQRLEVQVNNLKTERQNIERLQEIGVYLLKFQMGYPLKETLTLSEKLADIQLSQLSDNELYNDFNYDNRIEYSIFKTQERLSELDVKNNKAAILPRVIFTGNTGYSTGTDKFNVFANPWFNSASIGFVVQVPIFDGFGRKYKTIQAQNNLKKLQGSINFLKESIDLQLTSSKIQLKNYLVSLGEQKKNMDLASEVVRVTKTKYQAGVGSNLEVINAEASLKESQTNYLTSLYNVVIAKVEADKAAGKLGQ
jgi:outer membrane protein TolC